MIVGDDVLVNRLDCLCVRLYPANLCTNKQSGGICKGITLISPLLVIADFRKSQEESLNCVSDRQRKRNNNHSMTRDEELCWFLVLFTANLRASVFNWLCHKRTWNHPDKWRSLWKTSNDCWWVLAHSTHHWPAAAAEAKPSGTRAKNEVLSVLPSSTLLGGYSSHSHSQGSIHRYSSLAPPPLYANLRCDENPI